MMSRRLNRDFVRLLHITRMFGKFRPFTPNPGNNHYYLLICPRVHNPGQHQPGYRHEQGPEHCLHVLVLPERLDHRLRIRLNPLAPQSLPCI